MSIKVSTSRGNSLAQGMVSHDVSCVTCGFRVLRCGSGLGVLGFGMGLKVLGLGLGLGIRVWSFGFGVLRNLL